MSRPKTINYKSQYQQILGEPAKDEKRLPIRTVQTNRQKPNEQRKQYEQAPNPITEYFQFLIPK